jgi:hypothetical protein
MKILPLYFHTPAAPTAPTSVSLQLLALPTSFESTTSSDHPDSYRLDTPFVLQPTDCTLDPIHHVPLLQHSSELDSRMNPHVALLYYPDATLQDNVNGPITMQHLPACVDASFTAANFCLQYIHSINARKECIQDLTTNHLHHFFYELHPNLTKDPASPSDTDDSIIEYIQCIQYTLNRTANLAMYKLTS